MSTITTTATGHVFVREGARGPVWYAKFRTPDGRQHKRVIGPAWTTRGRCPDGHYTRSTAEEHLRRMLTDAERGTLAGLKRRDGHTFGDACEEFLRHREFEKEIAETTLRAYRITIDKTLTAHFAADTPLDRITDQDVTAFRRELVESGISKKTARHHMTLLSGIFERARMVKWTPTNPARDVERIRVPKTSGAYKTLTPEQVYALGRGAASGQDRALYVIAAFTGLRQGELRALRWGDVDYVNAYVHVEHNLPANGTGEKRPKSGKVRSVPLLDQAAVELDALSRRERFTGADDYVFVNTFGGPLHDDMIRKAFGEAMTNAGLGHLRAKTIPAGERFTFHDLRHTFGTIGARIWPLPELQGYMGHADITTTMIYVHHVPRVKAAAEASAYVAGQLGDFEAKRGPELGPEHSTSERSERT